MSWALAILGATVAIFGATSALALGVTGRAELARAVSRRLRGGAIAVTDFARIEDRLAAATAATSFGVVLVGVAVPGTLIGAPLLTIGVVVLGALLVTIIFGGELASRWLTEPRATALLRRLGPALDAWSRVISVALPARPARQPSDLQKLWRSPDGGAAAMDEEMLMIGGVMTFTDRPVREVMTPRTDVVAIAEDTPVEEIRRVFAQSGYSRLPVYRGTLDEIVGMLHAFDLFRLEPGDPLPIRPVAMAPGSRSCGDLLLDMQRERRHLAVVLDEYGGTDGIVTLEDLLEELVGEIYDEHDDQAQAARPAAPPLLETDGATPIAAVEERFGVRLAAEHEQTIGGLLARRLGRIPAAGERLRLGGLDFDVLQSSPTRVERLLIRPQTVAPIVLDREAL